MLLKNIYALFSLLLAIAAHAADSSNTISTDDFGNVLHEVLISPSMMDEKARMLDEATKNLMATLGGNAEMVSAMTLEKASEYIHNDLREKLEGEGCNVITANAFYYVRDAKPRSPNNCVLRTSDGVEGMSTSSAKSPGEIIFHDSLRREAYRKYYHAMAASEHPQLKNIHCGSSLQSGNAALYKRTGDGLTCGRGWYDSSPLLTESKSEVSISNSPSCFEGGNVIVATNQNGEIKVLIGEESLFFTHQLLRHMGFFKPYTENSFAATYATASRNQFLSYLYLAKRIPAMLRDLAIAVDERYPDEQILLVFGEMKALNVVDGDFDDSNFSAVRDLVCAYLAEQQFISFTLWPREFGVSANDIVILPQIAYHLDLFLKNSSDCMLCADVEQSNRLLQSLSATPGISTVDLALIDEYADEGKILQRELAPIYQLLYVMLERAGFIVEKIPAAFFSSRSRDKKNQQSFNFINALSGRSPTTNEPFYICLGAKVGDNLGNLLMNFFKDHMKYLVGPEINVHFIGAKKNGDELDYEPAMVFFNDRHAGVHCLSFELTQTKQ